MAAVGKQSDPSQVHTSNTICAKDLIDSQVQSLLAQAREQQGRDLLTHGQSWIRDLPERLEALWPWLAAQLHAPTNKITKDSVTQEALDVLLASICFPGIPTPRHEAHNRNWTWDRRRAPMCPDDPELCLRPKSSMSKPLSESARLLLAEWPVGEDPAAFTYRNPYGGLDFGEERQETRVPSSQPVRPTVQRASQKPQVVSRRLRPSQDQASSPIPPRMSQDTPMPSSSQEMDDSPGIAQTQIEPGRFGQRPAPKPPKRKKRMGGF